MNTLVLPGNISGRDFIIGDLHGMYSCLMKRLDAAKFDPSVDRVIGVGDLVNRGPESLACLGLLEKDWFYCAEGNHENIVLKCLRTGFTPKVREVLLDMGGDWLLGMNPKQLEKVQEFMEPLANLPSVIHVQDAVLPFNVLHAEAMGVFPWEFLTDHALRQSLNPDCKERLIWGRRNIKHFRAIGEQSIFSTRALAVSGEPSVPGLGLTYVGHSIVPRPVLHRSHAYLDTGAFTSPNRNRLTMVEHRSFVRQKMVRKAFNLC